MVTSNSSLRTPFFHRYDEDVDNKENTTQGKLERDGRVYVTSRHEDLHEGEIRDLRRNARKKGNIYKKFLNDVSF